MVFTTTNLFKGIACPEGERCQLTSCVFSHDLRPQATASGQAGPEAFNAQEAPANKRRKIVADDKPGRPLSKSDQIREQLAAHRNAGPQPHSHASRPLPSLDKPVTPPPTNGKKSIATTSSTQPGNNNHQEFQTTKPLGAKPKDSLNPRLIPNDPVGHAKRMLYLKHIHGDMVRLNQKIETAEVKEFRNNQHLDAEHRKHLLLTDAELIALALDEEEALARTHGQLYPNKAKQCVAGYKKMDLNSWIGHINTKIAELRGEGQYRGDPEFSSMLPLELPTATATNDTSASSVSKAKAGGELEEKVITTGLTPDEEPLILPYLISDQTNLAQHGYVPAPPSEIDAARAKAVVEDNKCYEKCDRCGTNFQVFPERNEEGLLTSKGPCKFHLSRKVNPPKIKNDFHASVKQPYHPCCNEIQGSVGCTTHDSHVFKIDPVGARDRLAAVLPFIDTPENAHPSKDKQGKVVKAVSFDCEMGYTTCGLELIRLTAVEWPSGEELLDVLVRPVGTIIDLNSRFSGVFPEHFAKAIPYEEWASYVLSPPAPDDDTASPLIQVLPVVSSIPAARALLTAFLTRQTPLIGHAIDNDLNSVRLCHPNIIDTIILFRHPRGPLPLRMGLKALAAQHLGKRIQQGGDRGHDSAEDARATGTLVRVKVREQWAKMQRSGCAIVDGKLGRYDHGGAFKTMEELADDNRAFGDGGAEEGTNKRGNRHPWKKRKRSYDMDGAADEEGDGSTETEGEKPEPARTGIAAFLPKA